MRVQYAFRLIARLTNRQSTNPLSSQRSINSTPCHERNLPRFAHHFPPLAHNQRMSSGSKSAFFPVARLPLQPRQEGTPSPSRRPTPPPSLRPRGLNLTNRSPKVPSRLRRISLVERTLKRWNWERGKRGRRRTKSERSDHCPPSLVTRKSITAVRKSPSRSAKNFPAL